MHVGVSTFPTSAYLCINCFLPSVTSSMYTICYIFKQSHMINIGHKTPGMHSNTFSVKI